MTAGRVVRFGLVGVVNTGTYYVLYLLLRHVVPYLVAHVLAFGLSMVGSYFLNCWFTFRVRPTLRRFLLFPLSNATSFCVTTAGLYVLVDLAGMNDRIAPLAAAAVAIPVTFVVAQFVLTGRRPALGRSSRSTTTAGAGGHVHVGMADGVTAATDAERLA